MQPVFRPAYAGIGSRKTPADVQLLMHKVAVALAAKGWILRSGGAPGADQAFLSGAINHHQDVAHCVETYLPWSSFESEALDNLAMGNRDHVARWEPAPWTFPIAADYYHSPWENVKVGVQKLMARNVHQILGYDQLQEKSFDIVRMVVCWTPEGKDSGGTGQALRIAREYGVEVRNLHDPEVRAKVEAFVG